MEPERGRILGQKFALERPLARGGMGSVWAGRHLTLDVPIAVKLMTEALVASQAARARFEREAKAAAQLRSPHVVQILDYGVDDETPYMVLELLTGEDLRARLERTGRLSLDATSTIVTQIAKGLSLAHDAGIVHRDLKPSNVFLAKIGEDEVVKLLDFGVAKQLEWGHPTPRAQSGLVDDSTATGQVLGSPTYMSPEQARGGTVDHRSDLWSLGVVAFQALTGQRPFAGDHVGDVIAKICSDALPVPSRVAPDLPASLDAFFARAFCRSADGRFPSARAMADALSQIAAESPLSARVAPPISRMPAAREDETVSQAPLVTSRPEQVDARGGDASAAPARTTPGTAAPARSRPWGWLALPALAAGAWLVWQSPIFRGSGAPADSATAIASPPSTPAAVATPGPSVTPEPSAAPSSSATAPASARVAPPPGRPAGRLPAPRRDAGATPIDPKFGLPVGGP